MNKLDALERQGKRRWFRFYKGIGLWGEADIHKIERIAFVKKGEKKKDGWFVNLYDSSEDDTSFHQIFFHCEADAKRFIEDIKHGEGDMDVRDYHGD